MPNCSTSLPRLLYLGDVPVESSHHGSALLYRLFEEYPADRLMVVESDLALSQPARRLPSVSYRVLPAGNRRLLNSRFHGLYSGWLSWTAPSRATGARSLLEGFVPDAIISVGHGYSWLTAASVAEKFGVPFHLIVHDDWPRINGISWCGRSWLERRFAAVYRQAKSRLCVSPFMVEEYERRYRARGDVLYPSRSADCPAFACPSPRLVHESSSLVVGYAGNSSPGVMNSLTDLASSLNSAGGTLRILGPFSVEQQARLRSICPGIVFSGLVPFREMIMELRNNVDLLFVAMPFEKTEKDNMRLAFQSKLADYTSIGLPILIYGPEYCSAVRWACANPGVAVVVDQKDPLKLADTLKHLNSNLPLRKQLATRAMQVGEIFFAFKEIQQKFYSALRDTSPNFSQSEGRCSPSKSGSKGG